MFERFSDAARQVIVLAQQEAVSLGHDYIGTEHLLLGLLRDPDSVAGNALAGLSLQGARDHVTRIVPGGRRKPASGHIPFTPHAKKALEMALRKALELGHNFVGTGHILLALADAGDVVATQVLAANDTDPASLRAAVLEGLASGPGEERRDEQPDRYEGGPHPDLTHVLRRLDEIEGLLQGLLDLVGDPPPRSRLLRRWRARGSYQGLNRGRRRPFAR